MRVFFVRFNVEPGVVLRVVLRVVPAACRNVIDAKLRIRQFFVNLTIDFYIRAQFLDFTMYFNFISFFY